MRKNIIRIFVAISIILGCIVLPQCLRADDNKEYLVKAAFIYNFVKFIEWPNAKAISQQSNIDICVIGENQLESAAQVFKAASTPKLALSLVQENNSKKIAAHCHIVFISQSEKNRLPEILAALKGQSVLTVSDIDNFAEQGGMIGFVTDNNKVKIEVNTKSVTAAGLRIDAQLLEIATKVMDK